MPDEQLLLVPLYSGAAALSVFAGPSRRYCGEVTPFPDGWRGSAPSDAPTPEAYPTAEEAARALVARTEGHNAR